MTVYGGMATAGGTGWSVGGGYYVTTNTTSTAVTTNTLGSYGPTFVNTPVVPSYVTSSGKYQIREACEILMPDGSIIAVDKNGNYTINDKDAKVKYRANNNREFNRYINASDMLEEFVEFVKKSQVNKEEFLELPIELFINFLVVRAAEEDGDDIPDVQVLDHPALLPPPPAPILALPAPAKVLNRCKNSGRFIRHDSPVPFASKTDMLAYAEKVSW